MLNKKTFRYTAFILSLITVILLYKYYQDLSDQKASIIQLASFYPYTEEYFEETQDGFERLAGSYYGGDFFQDSSMYENLVEKLSALQKSQDTLAAPLIRLDEEIWTSKLSPFEFYEGEIFVPEKFSITFYRSAKEYIDAFKTVLKKTHLKWHMRRQAFSLTFDIDLDVKSSEIALEEFERIFSKRDLMEINKRTFNLKRLTFFELFVVLEQIKWYRNRVEYSYLKAMGEQQEKGEKELRRKWLTIHPQDDY